MSAQIIDGKKLAEEIKQSVKEQVLKLKTEKKIIPGLAAILVGEDPASVTYVSLKEKACAEAGIYSEVQRLPENIAEKELLKIIENLNRNKKIHGILVQLPLPKHLNKNKVLRAVAPAKDVDGFHPINLGKLLSDDETGFVASTPLGILRLIESLNYDLKGKKAAIIGRSIEVGKPIALLLMARHATVTICHSRTVGLEKETREADVLVAAVGRPKMITGSMVKPGAVVIDVGTNRVEDKLVGDVDFDSVKEVAGWITPVPGGVGPMTIALLLENTLKAAGETDCSRTGL